MNFRIKTSANSHETATSKFEKGKNVFISESEKNKSTNFKNFFFILLQKIGKIFRVTHI